jgi:hypothetical protein
MNQTNTENISISMVWRVTLVKKEVTTGSEQSICTLSSKLSLWIRVSQQVFEMRELPHSV